MIHTWANVALILLVVLSIIAWSVPLVLLFFSVKGMRWTRQRMHHLAPQAHQHVRQATEAIERSSQRAARPVIRLHAWWAGVQAALHVLRHGPSTSADHRNDEVTS